MHAAFELSTHESCRRFDHSIFAVPKSRVVQLQNVVCADHKNLIIGKKRILMMKFKLATV